MKLTVWKQFASNHSNSFTLVGIYENEEQAEKAFKRIYQLIEDIDEWCEENGVDKYDNWDATAPERDIAEEYGFEWDIESPTDFWSRAARKYKNIVTIETDADSWTRRRPYQILLQKLGGNVAGYDGVPEDNDPIPTIFRTQITAMAPTEETAELLFQRWQKQLGAKKAIAKKDGLRITISNLVFNLDLFTAIVKSLEEAHCTAIDYQLEKENIDTDLWEDL